MNSEELEKLPYSRRLAQMGRQKVSRSDHNKRLNDIQNIIKKTPTKRTLLQTPSKSSLKEPLLQTPSRSSLKEPLLQTPSRSSIKEPLLQTPDFKTLSKKPPGPPGPYSSPKTPKQQPPPFKKRITTVHTPPVWQRDYRNEDRDIFQAEENDQSTKISLTTSHKSSSHKSSLSVTITNPNQSFNLNVLHSTLGRNEENEPGDPKDEAERPQSPDMFSDPQDRDEVTGEEPFEEITEATKEDQILVGNESGDPKENRSLPNDESKKV